LFNNKFLIVSISRSYSEKNFQTTFNLNSDYLTLLYNRQDGTCSFYSKISLLNNFIQATNTEVVKHADIAFAPPTNDHN
jgi:hypothetical protein